MKITKSQLKQIIKEELESVLKKSVWHGPGPIAEPAAIDEDGAFASDEEIQDITNVASEVDPDIQSWPEFYEAVRIAWNEGKLKSKHEVSKHEIREAWKKHPGNMFTHDPRLR